VGRRRLCRPLHNAERIKCIREAARAAGLPDNSPEMQMLAAVRSALEPRYGSWRFLDELLQATIEGMIRWRSIP